MKKIYTYIILTALLLTTLAFGAGSHGPFFWKLVQGVLSPVDSSVSVELPGPLTVTGTIASGGEVLGVVTHNATEAGTSANMYGQHHLVTGAYTITLPAVVLGMSSQFEATTAAVMCLDSNASNQFLNGATLMTAGYKLCTDGTLGSTIAIEVTQANKIKVFCSGVCTDSGA